MSSHSCRTYATSRALTDDPTASTATGRPQPVSSVLRLSVMSWPARQQIVRCGRNRHHRESGSTSQPDVPRAWQSERPGPTQDRRQPLAIAAIHFPDVGDTSGSTAIPDSVLDDYRLSPEARLVYVALRRLATTSYGRLIDQRELARSIGIPAHRLSKHLTLLARNGHLQVRSDRSPDAQTAVRYWLVEPTRLKGDPPARTPTIARHSQRRRGASASIGLRLVDRLIVMGLTRGWPDAWWPPTPRSGWPERCGLPIGAIQDLMTRRHGWSRRTRRGWDLARRCRQPTGRRYLDAAAWQLR
jgi:hypothetical protein